MRPRWRLVFPVAIAMVLGATTLFQLLRPPRRELDFAVPDRLTAQRAEQLFATFLDQRGTSNAARQLGRSAEALGLEARSVASPRALALSEPDQGCAGHGTYLVRAQASIWPVAIVAPHRGADRDTGALAGLLFDEQPFAAAAWNSAPRRGGAQCSAGGDVTRFDTHFMTAFSLAFAARFPGGRIVQLHGFDPALRREARAAGADAIISEGSDRPGERLLDLADCLSRAFPGRDVVIFPIETRELGATTNAQGQALRTAGYSGFSHVELSPAFRRDLLRDAEQRRTFAGCLVAGL